MSCRCQSPRQWHFVLFRCVSSACRDFAHAANQAIDFFGRGVARTACAYEAFLVEAEAFYDRESVEVSVGYEDAAFGELPGDFGRWHVGDRERDRGGAGRHWGRAVEGDAFDGGEALPES